MAEIKHPYEAGARWTPVVATVMVTISLIFVNLDGYQYELVGGREFFGEPPIVNWVHGWPRGSLVRQSTYPLSGVYSSPTSFSGPHGLYSRWPFDGAPVMVFWLGPFVFDCVFFVLAVFGTAYATRRWGKTFSLRFLFAATSFVAVACAAVVSTNLWSVIQRAYTSPAAIADEVRYTLQFSALFVVAVAVALTVYSALHITCRLIGYYRHRSTSPLKVRSPSLQ